jgi:hypothetical protein
LPPSRPERSTIVLSLAAAFTVGGKLPDGSTAPRGDVLMWSGEDEFEDSILPRLIVFFGDLASNIGPEGGGFDYDLEQVLLPDYGFRAQQIVWGNQLESDPRTLLSEVEDSEPAHDRAE